MYIYTTYLFTAYLSFAISHTRQGLILEIYLEVMHIDVH